MQDLWGKTQRELNSSIFGVPTMYLALNLTLYWYKRNHETVITSLQLE